MIDNNILIAFANRNVLVTGGTGMIGRQVVKILCDAGSTVKVVYLDDKENWSVPNNIIEVKICKETLDRAGKWCKSISEIYLENYTPRNECQKHINAFTKYKE